MDHQLHIKATRHEYFDEYEERFRYFDQKPLTIEYSLHTMSIYEMKTGIPFTKCTDEEELYRCMTIESDPKCSIDYSVIKDQIQRYMNKQYTASTINVEGGKASGRGQIITTEVLYAQMFANSIPMECDRWHLNRLIMLIRVVGEMNKGPQKADPNAQRQREYEMIKARNEALSNGSKNKV